MSKQNVKNLVLPHSAAKLETYHNYLEKYIQVLVASQIWSQINIYDVFCGSGIYEDGQEGSPILAFKAIQMNREWCVNNAKVATPITLNINDIDENKVNGVKQFISNQPKPIYTTLNFYNLQASEFLNKIQQEVNANANGVRNLIFIDPYGYREIQADTIKNLLANRSTEIILFLPVSFIYRFAGVAILESNVKQYEHLRRFIAGFFPLDHPIQQNEVKSVLEFIQSLKNVLTFNGQFFTASYSLQRDKANYFALFFMTSNLKGLEKFLETKWEVDPIKGEGYKMPDPRGPSLFEAEFNEKDRDERIQSFAESLKDFLKNNQRSDADVYKFTLFNEFIPKHTTSILKEWQGNELLEVWDFRDSKPAQKGSFNINYNSTKAAGSKFTFKLKR